MLIIRNNRFSEIMLRKLLASNTPRIRWLSAKSKVQMDEVVFKKLENDGLNPKRHPGIVKSQIIRIPEWVVNGMLKATEDASLKTLSEDADRLASYLNQRHPPPEQHEINSKLMEAKEKISQKIDLTKLTQEEINEFWKKNNSRVNNYLHQHIYSWAPIQYDDYKSLVYMLARGAQDYAILHHIFNEICHYDPNFQPKTLFDFGSGIGTVVWAASEFWKKSLAEYYCVDSSADMNNLAEIIIGKEPHGIKNVYYRQFLPVSAKIRSNIVVSAFSLFEIPNVEARLQLILNLWSKTDKYLVIVEQGTNAGFKLVNEARDFILQMSMNSLETEKPNPCHVFAPCPHDTICPRYLIDQTPCNFQISYHTLPLGKNSEHKRERYSYVVIKKGKRAENDQQWPRIVRPTLVRAKHTICRMCTAAGKLEEVIFTAAKDGKYAYKCARYSDWGDKLPLRLVDQPRSKDTE